MADKGFEKFSIPPSFVYLHQTFTSFDQLHPTIRPEIFSIKKKPENFFGNPDIAGVIL